MAQISELPAAFGLRSSGELVSIVGGGGKSTLMFALARSLPGRVVTTTTTRIFAAQMKLAPAVCILAAEDAARLTQNQGGRDASGNSPAPQDREEMACASLANLGALLDRHQHCLIVGEIVGEKAAGVPVELPGRLLARTDVDFVLVEADGSRMRPCKAPAAHEPVIPPETTLLVPVAGIDAVGGRLADVAHRPELVATLTGLELGDKLTAQALAALIIHPEGGLKTAPKAARVIPLINKVETARGLADARQVARLCLEEETVGHVVIGALRSGKPIREIQRRVTAVVLAAGTSERMGQTKQLLPWGQTTVLGQTLANLQASAVIEILVVVGHEAEAVRGITAEAGVPTLTNPHYASGELLSSLKVAIRALPANRSAVLVVLADQPLVEPETIDILLSAYWQGSGQIIAPAYRGQRGNPVLIDRGYFEELLGLPEGGAPRELLKRHPEAVKLVDVSSESILIDLDSAVQYERWRPK